jgi:hypothetical protein
MAAPGAGAGLRSCVSIPRSAGGPNRSGRTTSGQAHRARPAAEATGSRSHARCRGLLDDVLHPHRLPFRWARFPAAARFARLGRARPAPPAPRVGEDAGGGGEREQAGHPLPRVGREHGLGMACPGCPTTSPAGRKITGVLVFLRDFARHGAPPSHQGHKGWQALGVLGVFVVRDRRSPLVGILVPWGVHAPRVLHGLEAVILRRARAPQ